MTAAKKMDRTQGLGGSDMAAILGVETYKVGDEPKNALHVYLEKIGESPPRESTLAMRLGVRFEDGIAQEWAADNGVKVRRRNLPVISPDHPWMRGHVDRMIVGTGEGLEVKASSTDGWGEEGTNDIPINMLPQIHHYLTALPKAPRWRIAALLWNNFGPPALCSYVVERDEEMSGILIRAGERFMQEHVEPRIPPTPTSSDQASLLWKRAVEGKKVRVTVNVLISLARLEAAKVEQKAATADRKAHELVLKVHLEEADLGVDEEDKPLYTWKEQSQDRFDEARLKLDKPEIHAEFRKTLTFRKLHVTKRGKAAAEQVAAQLPEDTDGQSV